MRTPTILAALVIAATLTLGWLSIAAIMDGPRLVLTARPRLGLSPLRIVLRAEIKGEMRRDWRCPEVVWEMPDGTEARYQEDCDPDYDEAPRVWTYGASVANDGDAAVDVPFTVKLIGPTGLLAAATVTVRVLG